MKTRTFFTTMLILLAGFIYAQTCTLKWTQNNGKSGSSRTETFDFEWGITDKGVRGPYKLAIHSDDGLITGSRAYSELMLPKWGDNKNQTFAELLPYVPKPAKQYLQRKQFPWFNLSDTLPIDQAVKGYECRTAEGKIFQGLTYETAPFWANMGVIKWRPWNPSPNQAIFQVPNPEYPVIEAWRQTTLAEWERLISTTFVQTANYVFPTFKYSSSAKWYMKCEDDPDWMEYPVDNLNPLSGDGRYKKHRQAVKPSDQKPWESYYFPAIYLDGDKKLKRILDI
jgi:hypothetical protein